MYHQDLILLCLNIKLFILSKKTISMSIITLFNYFKRPEQYLPLVNVLNQIKTGKYRKLIQDLRSYYEEDLGSDYDAQLRVIPRFSVSGNFRMRDDQLKAISYSGNLLLEIPYLNSNDLKAVKMLLSNDPFVLACFENALGTGLVLIIKSNSKMSEHKLMFKCAVRYYQKLTGVNRFAADGEDYDHMVMVSLDAYTYIAKEAVPFPNHLKAVIAYFIEQLVSLIRNCHNLKGLSF